MTAEVSTTPRKSAGWRVIANIALLVGLVAIFGWQVAKSWSAIKTFDWSLDWGLTGLSLALLLVCSLADIFIWNRTLAWFTDPLPFRQAAPVYIWSFLARYIPGKVGSLLLRMALAADAGRPGVPVLASSTVELALRIAAAFVVALVTWLGWGMAASQGVLIAAAITVPVVLLGSHPKVMLPVINWALKKTGRDASKIDEQEVRSVVMRLSHLVESLSQEQSLDVLRGIEGDAAHIYFNVFDHLIVSQKENFRFDERNRRPPLDNVNCLLSFIYTLLMHDVRSALESVGLDPAVGFLHRDRPGRPGLALDLMEEFRPYIADRLVLSLINLQQVQEKSFKKMDSGAVVMDDDARKKILVAYQERKQEEITHPFLDEKVMIGMLFHIQALLMARYLRGDMDGYPRLSGNEAPRHRKAGLPVIESTFVLSAFVSANKTEDSADFPARRRAMFVLVSYDVSTTDPKGPRRLNRVAKACKDYGQRVQYSVFECIVDPAQWAVLKDRLIKEIDDEKDSLRFYYLGSNWRRRVEHIGAKGTVDQEGPLIV